VELARAIGIAVPRIRLVPVNCIRGLPADAGSIADNALVIEHFDRGLGGQVRVARLIMYLTVTYGRIWKNCRILWRGRFHGNPESI
jgi:hypothetical protein